MRQTFDQWLATRPDTNYRRCDNGNIHLTGCFDATGLDFLSDYFVLDGAWGYITLRPRKKT